MIFNQVIPISRRNKLYVLAGSLFIITGFFLLPYARVSLASNTYFQYAITHQGGKLFLCLLWFAGLVQAWFFFKKNKSLSLLWFFAGLLLCAQAVFLWAWVHQTFNDIPANNLAVALVAKAQVMPGMYGVFATGVSLVALGWRNLKRP